MSSSSLAITVGTHIAAKAFVLASSSATSYAAYQGHIMTVNAVNNHTNIIRNATKTFPEDPNEHPQGYYVGKYTHKVVSYLSNSSPEDPYYFGKVTCKMLGLHSTKKIPMDVDLPKNVKLSLFHTKVGKRNFSVVTIIQLIDDQHHYAIHHMIVKDHIADLDQLLTAIKLPYWKSDTWSFKADVYGIPEEKVDTSYCISNFPDADTRTDIHCFTIDGHPFSLILTRSLLDVHFGVRSGDIRSYIGKVIKFNSPDVDDSVVISNMIPAWWTYPTLKAVQSPP